MSNKRKLHPSKEWRVRRPNVRRRPPLPTGKTKYGARRRIKLSDN